MYILKALPELISRISEFIDNPRKTSGNSYVANLNIFLTILKLKYKI